MSVLASPHADLRYSFLAAMREFRAEGRGAGADRSSLGSDLMAFAELWQTPRGFEEYVGQLRAQSFEDTPRPWGHVPCTTLWWSDGSGFLGRIAVRHRLTPFLLEAGGHIGYDVRPSARRRGHATAMLGSALPVARDLGVSPALLTCDVDNVGSRTVIERNGGLFEDRRGSKLRFWVPTDSGSPGHGGSPVP